MSEILSSDFPDEPVFVYGTRLDRIHTEKQRRLLIEPLYTGWSERGAGRTFLALANVGWFHTAGQPPVVPDSLFSLDVAPVVSLHTKEGHFYYQWLMGKPPEVVFEIVSDQHGGEEHLKMQLYTRLRVTYYVIYDPDNLLGNGVLRVYGLSLGKYERIDPNWLSEVGLGLTLWEGEFEHYHDTWLRWCDENGVVIPTGAERAESEHVLAEDARRRASEADEKVRRLEAQLEALGIDPVK